MSYRDLLRLVLANLNRMRTRVALTAIGVIIGTAAVIVLISLGVGLQTSTSSLLEIGDLRTIEVRTMGGIGDEAGGGARDQVVLDEAALDAMRALPNVAAVTPLAQLQGWGELKLGREEGSGFIQGIDPSVVDEMDWELAEGQPRLARGQVIVGPKIFEEGFEMFGAMVAGAPQGQGGGGEAAEEATPLLGRTLTLTLHKFDAEGNEILDTERLRVVGVFAEGNQNHNVYATLQQVDDMNRWFTGTRRNPRDGFEAVVVKAREPDQVLEIQAQIDAMGFFTQSQQQFLREINRAFLVIQGVLGGVGAIALLVAAFGIANTMTMAIYERTREIGIMKAIGATNNDVLRIFLAEAGAIGLVGGLLGVSVGWAIGQAIQLVAASRMAAGAAAGGGEAATPTIVVTPWWLMAFALAFATGVGVLSGIYPALRAAGMKPLRALRSE